MKQTYDGISFGESARILKMAFPRYFKRYALNARSGETAALLTMLEKGCVECGYRRFRPVKHTTKETRSEVDRFAEILRKKSYSRVLRSALHVFSAYRPDPGRVKYGALFYPKLKLYLCVGYLTPKILLYLLADPDCEQAAVFANMAKLESENHYFLFARGGSPEEYSRIAKNCGYPL